MMRSTNRIPSLLLAGAVVIWATGACSGDTPPPQTSSATHFLEDCSVTCSDGLQCICGVCTKACAATSDCTTITAKATCTDTSSTDPSCTTAASAKVCDVPCAATADCDSTAGAPVCVSGFCRSVATATMQPKGMAAGGKDGGASGAGGKGSGGRSDAGDAATSAGGSAPDGSLESGSKSDASSSGGTGGSSSGGGGAGGGSGGTNTGGTPPGDASASDCQNRVLYDPKNCGRCGHDCQGGICASGICQPTILALGQTGTGAIAVDETNVYWITGTALNKVSAVGGPALAKVTPLASGLTQPQDLAVSDTAVFFTSYADSANVGSVPKNGGPITGIASGQSLRPLGIAIDAAYVYWGRTTNGFVSRVPLVGGTVQPISAAAGDPNRMVVDSENVYWVDTVNGFVMKAPIGGGAATPLASGQNTPLGIGVQNGHVYWTTYPPPNGAVKGITTDGSISETIADGLDYPYSLAADSSGVYWTTLGNNSNGSTGTVLMRALSGGPIVLLASGEPSPAEIAVNSGAVFWLNGSGEIMKIAKP